MEVGSWETVRVELDDGIAWVELNRPEKRNAMNPQLNADMIDVLETLDGRDDYGVLVLTGAGDAFCAGMDLKEYFREVDASPEHVQRRVRRDANYWQWRLLRTYANPTIAMVNGWCFGGAFTPLVACDLAVAADDATFGLSEINWGIPPGSVVSKALAETVGSRAGLLYVMTGRTFDGRQAAAMGLVNSSVPRARLRYVTGRLDRVLRRRLSAAVEPVGLTLPAYVALSVLRAQNGLSNAQLARRSLVTPQSMSEALTQLVDRGYVRRRADPGHGRI